MLVRIKRDSLRPNPTAGRMVYDVCTGPPRMEMVRVVKLASGRFRRKQYAGQQLATGLRVQIVGASTHAIHPHPECDVRMTQFAAVKRVYSLTPSASHLFEYEDPEVTCHSCGRTCRVSELQSDSDDGDGYAVYTAEQCPHCGVWHVLDDERIAFERLQDAMADLSLSVGFVG